MTKNLLSLLVPAVALAAMASPALAQRPDAAPSTLIAKPTDGGKGDADGAFISLGKFSEPTGELIYKRVCAGCHMPQGQGAQGAGKYPTLAKNTNLATSLYPLSIVLHGKHGMPAVGRMMSDQQVADVVNYIRSNLGNKYKDKVTAADAKAAR